VVEDNDGLHIKTREQIKAEVQAYFACIGPVFEIDRAMELKEASWWLMKAYSRISSVNLFFSFIPAALRIVRIDLAVRPCFPITLPRSL
jgi:hypothetical protein